MVRALLLMAATLGFSLPGPAAVTVDKISYRGWSHCYRITNGEIEMVVTADVGPRIIRLGFLNGQNLFKEYADQMGKSGEAKFQLRGGHRVWKAPEDPIATWAPDNVPVEIQVTERGLIAREPKEPLTGLQKEIEIWLAARGTAVTVANRITNHTLFPLEFSAWTLTMMAPGGVAITTFPPRGKHPAVLEATNPLVMWAYTDFTDPRWKITTKYLTLRMDPKAAEPQKLGTFNRDTWAAYALNGEVFIKRTQADPSRAYPDFGCSFETFTNNEFLEMETLSPLTRLQPGQTVEHIEHWSLHRGVALNTISDEALDRLILPLAQATGGAR